MDLIVEDGTGIAGADTYASLDAAAAYWIKRANSDFAMSWPSQVKTDAMREGALREASAYLDANWGQGYPGVRKTTTQGLLWPRTPIVPATSPAHVSPRHYGISRPYRSWEDPLHHLPIVGALECPEIDPTLIYGVDGLPLDPLPAQIVTATIELGARALLAPLEQDYVTGARLKSERDGDQENVYFDDGRAGSSYGFLALILAPLLVQRGQAAWGFR